MYLRIFEGNPSVSNSSKKTSSDELTELKNQLSQKHLHIHKFSYCILYKCICVTLLSTWLLSMELFGVELLFIMSETPKM